MKCISTVYPNKNKVTRDKLNIILEDSMNFFGSLVWDII